MNQFARNKMKSVGLPYENIIGKTDYDMPWKIQADYLREIGKVSVRSVTFDLYILNFMIIFFLVI
jgi:hypothetical protein